jgi:FAD/FMN-containing dehydrogenase
VGRSPQDLVADDPRRWATVGDAALAELGGRFRGELIAPGDERYDAARVVWNRGVDKHPRLIARCAGVADIVAALRFARDHELLIAVRGGGHNVAGNALCDDGVVIDLSALKGIHIDRGARRARV